MAQGRLNLMDPPIEDLLDKVDSKFTLVALGALRARQVNAYYNSLGEGLGRIVPPQVASVSGKPLSIAFEEIADAKATYVRLDPEELAALEQAEAEPTEAELAEVALAEVGLAKVEQAEVAQAEVELTGLEGGLLAEGADGPEGSTASDTAAEVPAEDEGPAAG